MAKINEDAIIIKVSELVRDDQNAGIILDNDTIAQLEAVVQELVGPGKIVEIVRG